MPHRSDYVSVRLSFLSILFLQRLLDGTAEVFGDIAHLQGEVDILDEAAGDAGGKAVFEIRDALAAVLIVTLSGRVDLLTPANLLMLELVWAVPGLLVSEWTRNF